MFLKTLAIVTFICSLVIFILLINFKIPLVYMPQNATQLQFIVIYFVFIILEVLTLAYLFLHMLETSKIDLNYELMKVMKEE